MRKKKTGFKKFVRESILFENNFLMLLVGLCPMLAASTKVIDALVMSIVAVFTLILSALLMKLLSTVIPESIKSIVHVLFAVSIIAAFELVIHAYLPTVFERVGIYLPLIAVSGILSYSYDGKKKKVLTTITQASAWSCAFGVSTLVLAIVREFFGRGSLAGFQILPEEYAMTLIREPAGGLILLGILIAVLRAYVGKTEEKEGKV